MTVDPDLASRLARASRHMDQAFVNRTSALLRYTDGLDDAPLHAAVVRIAELLSLSREEALQLVQEARTLARLGMLDAIKAGRMSSMAALELLEAGSA